MWRTCCHIVEIVYKFVSVLGYTFHANIAAKNIKISFDLTRLLQENVKVCLSLIYVKV